ncbi:MAG: DUF3047 domain-containing protein [Candidatus Omnitrophica bacterium]|nr:DUF3047 domain-containing protein [Candidatus Omnitrophota bacterium]
MTHKGARVTRGVGVALLSLWMAGCSTRRIAASLMPPLIPQAPPVILWREAFDALDPARWREAEVNRQTRYEVVTLDGRRCLRAESRGGASILLSAVRFNPHIYEWLSWQWRVDQPVSGEALERKEGSDVAARLYVYFETRGLPWQKRNLDYVWSAALPVGTIVTSAYSTQSKIIVVESGSSWLDYRRCFGGRLPDVIAIGLMSDTDNTGGAAVAYFDELRVSRRPSGAAPVSQAEPPGPRHEARHGPFQ